MSPHQRQESSPLSPRVCVLIPHFAKRKFYWLVLTYEEGTLLT